MSESASTADALSTSPAVLDSARTPGVLAGSPDVEVDVVAASTGRFGRYFG